MLAPLGSRLEFPQLSNGENRVVLRRRGHGEKMGFWMDIKNPIRQKPVPFDTFRIAVYTRKYRFPFHSDPKNPIAMGTKLRWASEARPQGYAIGQSEQSSSDSWAGTEKQVGGGEAA